MNDRPDLPRYRDDAPEPHIGYEDADRYGDDEGLRVGGLPHLGDAPSPFGGRRDPDPCSLVIFGVTGDLTHRKLIPALYDLGCHGVLPADTTLVGYGRQELGDDPLRARMREAIDDHYGQEIVDGALCERILRAPRYVHGELDEPEGYARLAAALDELDKQGSRGNRMFYLATPPSQFEPIIRGLGEAGLARRGAFDARARPGRAAGLDAHRHREAVRPRPRHGAAAGRASSPTSSTSGRCTASTTTSPRRPCRTCWCCASPTASSSPCGTGATWTTWRSRPRRRWASSTAARTTRRPGRCAT